MKNIWIVGLLALFLIMPNVYAGCVVYDDFTTPPLDMDKWNEVVATDMGQGQTLEMVDEHYVIDGIYHTAQVMPQQGGTGRKDRGIGLVVTNHIFQYGDTIEYDVNYISGEGNRQSTMMLNGDAYSATLIGYWNGIHPDGSNEYGIHHIKLTFLGYEGVEVEIVRPNGDINTWTQIYSKWGTYPSEEYTFGIVTRTGHNGLVHMDYDNVVICINNTEEVPEFSSVITVLMTTLLGFAFMRGHIPNMS